MNRKWMLALSITIVFLALTNGNLRAAQVRMTTGLGFGGYVIPGHWIPLRVQISGTVETGRIEVIRRQEGSGDPVIESFAFSNPGGGPNILEIPVLADFGIRDLTIRLYRGAQLLPQQSLNFTSKTFPGHLILTINLPASEQQAIEQSLRPAERVLTVSIQPEELPGLGLNYDGVSGLVINQPGLVLAPAQIKALRCWLTGGGRMIIFTDPRQSENLLRQLTGDRISRPEANLENFPVGFGGITVIRKSREDNRYSGLAGGWRRILNLKPFDQTFRLSASQSFPAPFPASPNLKFSWVNSLSVFLFIWAGAGVLISIFGKKRPLVCLLTLTFISVIAAVPLALTLASNWKHGAVWHTRAVILPDSGGMLINTNINLKPSQAWESGVHGSPWGVRIDRGKEESGGIRLENNRNTIWRHHLTRSRYSLNSGDSMNLVLTGYFPEFLVDLSGKTQEIKDTTILELHQIMIPNETLLWDGRRWRLLINNNLNAPKWREISEPPEWFLKDEEWLRSLQLKFPDTSWLGGRYLLPEEFRLKIQGGQIPEVFWGMPSPRDWSSPKDSPTPKD